MDSYQYFSRPNPTVISFDTSSAQLGSLFFALLADFNSDLSTGVSMGLLFLTCIMDALGVPDCSCDDGGGAAIWGDGWTTFNGLG